MSGALAKRKQERKTVDLLAAFRDAPSVVVTSYAPASSRKPVPSAFVRDVAQRMVGACGLPDSKERSDDFAVLLERVVMRCKAL